MEKYLNPTQAAKYVGLSRRTLDYAKGRGEIAYSKVGRAIRFSVDDLDAFMTKFRVELRRRGRS